jgi:FkbM family methyltransferase
MSVASVLRRTGNKAYEYAFPIYRPLYGAYKAYGDRAERQLLKKILFPGAVVVDAGANIGIYSQFLSHRVGSSGVVHSFEPSPKNFMRLCSATRKLPNVHVCQAVVGERSGKSTLYISDKLNVDHRAYPTEGDARRALQIKTAKEDGVPVPVPRDGTRDPPIKTPCRGSRLPRNSIATAGVGCVLVKAFAGGTPASTNKNALSDFFRQGVLRGKFSELRARSRRI